MFDLELQCQCGEVRGAARQAAAGGGLRLVCHCDDCQAYAHHLQRGAEVLDEFGGSDIYQLTPAQISITEGISELRCLRLRPKGVFRWYAECCHTPVGNVLSRGMPVVGLLHNFIKDDGGREDLLGPVRYYVQGKHATGARPGQTVHAAFPITLVARMFTRALAAKLQSKGRPSPFVGADGRFIVKPEVVAQAAAES